MLDAHGLFAYAPWERSDKADFGSVEDGIDFLGCTIQPRTIAPNLKSQTRVIDKIEKVISNGLHDMSCGKKTASLRKILQDVHHTLEGWGNTYKFCNCPDIFRTLDIRVDEKLKELHNSYAALIRKADGRKRKRELLGVHVLTEGKKKPIVQS
jgi:hypothetical protein